MSVSLFVRNKVKDFATWKKVYDGSAEFQKENGVIASSIHQSLDDPNVIIAWHQFTDVDAAKHYESLFHSDAFLEGPVKVDGVIPETMEIWLTEDIE